MCQRKMVVWACFNLAMLAKQACRLVDNSKLLCACGLHGKYCRDIDLLRASLRKKVSDFLYLAERCGRSECPKTWPYLESG